MKRVSVVRKPARGPSVRAKRPAVEPQEALRETAPPAAWRPAPLPSAGPITPSATEAIPAAPPAQEEPFQIPTGYGDDRIVLMVKDPWWLFAYWEIQPGTERAARGQLLPHEVAGLSSILRVYDVTGVDFPRQPARRSFDIGLSGLATNWYIQTNAPNRSFIVDIGLLAHTGRFLHLSRSNRVTTPRVGPSDVLDEAWMTTEEAYWKLLGASAGIGMGASPAGWSALLQQAFFSGQWSSPLPAGQGRAAVRGFWCRVDTDLVVYGATEPKATVTIQGQRVDVRPDGSFSLRMTLPEGTQTITVEVASPDGRHAATVAPIVSLTRDGSPRAEHAQPAASSMPKARGRG